jgi:hypothetical protein
MAAQVDLAVLDADLDHAALGELAEEQLFRQRLLDVLLDHAAQRAGAHLVVVALVGQPFGGGLGQLDGHVAVHQLGLELQDELLDHLQDDLLGQRREADHRIQTVAELRREGPFDRGGVLALAPVAAEADGGLGLLGGAGVRGHDQDHVAEIHRAGRCGRSACRGPSPAAGC